jgi:AtzE family amidohydrolase
VTVVTADISNLGAVETAEAVRSRKLTARRMASATLERIARHNPRLNAYTSIHGDEMLERAERIDRAIARGEDPGPLTGSVFGAKDLFDIAGHRTTAGASLRANTPAAREDAAAVAALRASGALLAGSQNMDEFAYGFSTENAHSGPTRNPHDTIRVAGGSSGGSAAAVAAGLCSVALGSDTNGSVRVPASFCGIYGLKPTYGRLSRRGIFPFVHSLDHVGVFARSAADLAAVYDALQVDDPRDPDQARRPFERVSWQIDKHYAPSIAPLGGYFREAAQPDTLKVLDEIAAHLGAGPEVLLPEVERARSAAFCLTAAEGGSLHLNDLRSHPQLYDHAVRDRLIAGAMLPAGLVQRAQRFRRWFRDRVAEIFENVDVLVSLTTPFPAQPIGQATIPMGGKELSIRANAGLYTQPISFIGFPALNVPLVGRGDLPIGLQLIARPWNEAALFQIARQLERAGICSAARPTDLAS